jgi:tetratricopeptide (TPR) repeat protein
MRISRSGALVLAVIACLGACRREQAKPSLSSAASPTAAPSPPEAVEASDVATREPRTPAAAGHAAVIWLGLDGLDFELLDRLASEGAMPNWKRLAAEGYTAKLSSDYPLISPMLWTTAATGVPPDVHRVLDFQEVDPASGRKVPISGRSRRAPAAWNLASAAGRKVGVVGWWATHPAEEVEGYFVSDRASPILFTDLPRDGVAFPASFAAGVSQIAGRDGRVVAADLAPYLDMPETEIVSSLSSGAGMENPVVGLGRVLGATRITQRIARDLYDRARPDLGVVYFGGTDEVGHLFAAFTPPRTDCRSVTDADVAKYGRVVPAYYAIVDRILGQWMRRAEEDGAVLLVHSDHGFKWRVDRPCGLASGDWSTAAFWHRPEGVLGLWGRGVRPGQPRGEARLVDIAPTVLALLGVPGDARMTGRPIAKAFEKPLRFTRAGDPPTPVRRVADTAMSEAEASEYAKKLLALGYLSPGETSTLAPTGGAEPGLTEGAWNNLGAWELRTRKNLPAAEAAFRESLRLNPAYYSPMFNLAALYRERGDTRSAEDWLLRSLANVKSDPSIAVVSWAREYAKSGRPAASASLLERASASFPDNEGIARERARFLHENKDCRGAAGALARFEGATRSPQTLNELALYETCLQNRGRVEQLLTRSLAMDPNQPAVAHALEKVRSAAP